jgi:hypothetical protein
MGRGLTTRRGIIPGLALGKIHGIFLKAIMFIFAMKNLTKIIFSLAAIAILFAAGSAFAQSCPMCKESMTAAGAKLSEGFYNSIMSMFLLPISMIGAGTVFVMKSGWVKRHPEAENLSTWEVMKEMLKEKRERRK